MERSLLLTLLGRINAAAPQVFEQVVGPNMTAKLFAEPSFQLGSVHYGGPKFIPPTPKEKVEIALRLIEAQRTPADLLAHAFDITATAIDAPYAS
jgi:hypothetical protein